MTFAIQHISNSKQLNILSTKIESLVPLLALPVSAGEEILCGHFQLYVRKEFILCEFFVGVEFMIICVCVIAYLLLIAFVVGIVFKFASKCDHNGIELFLLGLRISLPAKSRLKDTKNKEPPPPSAPTASPPQPPIVSLS